VPGLVVVLLLGAAVAAALVTLGRRRSTP
jgi:hypothetical protein